LIVVFVKNQRFCEFHYVEKWLGCDVIDLVIIVRAITPLCSPHPLTYWFEPCPFFVPPFFYSCGGSPLSIEVIFAILMDSTRFDFETF
jgi:hypothetical protein